LVLTMDIVQKDGFDFGFDPGACDRCPGYCCRGEAGHVWVSQKELLEMCRFLNTNPIAFIQGYLTRVDNRFSLKERAAEDGLECCFFDRSKKRCAIYEARPSQCRRYPFWEHFRKHQDLVVKECPGIRP
jgi:uncharacterized protein